MFAKGQLKFGGILIQFEVRMSASVVFTGFKLTRPLRGLIWEGREKGN